MNATVYFKCCFFSLQEGDSHKMSDSFIPQKVNILLCVPWCDFTVPLREITGIPMA